MNRELGPRLLAVASAVPSCESMVDCGCDHAYVSIHIAESGRVGKITASDINEGPLKNAESEIASAGFEKVIKTRLTDGLCGIDAHECVVIAGMGGETIAEIIEKTDWTKECKALVLQPMTKVEILREFLYREGFEIYREDIVTESKHIYNIISARYVGTVPYVPYEKYISRAALSEKLAAEYTDAIIERLSRELRSRVAASALSDEERERRENDLNSLKEMREKL
ncbi:MAG: SAM-dependent methyltransferase [Oscillospiraceae bacterium]|nr:SAM-dependent methyltransferase [Oscillospiraceae bacterium]